MVVIVMVVKKQLCTCRLRERDGAVRSAGNKNRDFQEILALRKKFFMKEHFEKTSFLDQTTSPHCTIDFVVCDTQLPVYDSSIHLSSTVSHTPLTPLHESAERGKLLACLEPLSVEIVVYKNQRLFVINFEGSQAIC